MVVVLSSVALTSCSDDDNDNGMSLEIPELPVPEYESSAAKYEITSATSDIKSIELTASGDYVIVPKDYTAQSMSIGIEKVGKQFKLASGFGQASRATNGLIWGKFIKVSDTEYILEGYGTVVIEGTSSTAISITATPINGEATTVSAVKASQKEDSPLTKAISRTWNINSIGLKIVLNRVIIYDGKKPASQYWDLVNAASKALCDYVNQFAEDEDDLMVPEIISLPYTPEGFAFTRAGTYLVFWTSDILGVATWHWKDESRNLMHFSWDYDNPSSEVYGEGGDATVYFDGTSMKLVEEQTVREAEDGEVLEMTGTTTYYCNL